MSDVILVGEPIIILAAQELGNVEEAASYKRFIAGAEINVAIGLTRLKHKVSYVSKLGADPFGKSIESFLLDQDIDVSNISYHDKAQTGLQFKGKTDVGDPEVVYFRDASASTHLSEEDIEAISLEGVKLVHITGIPLGISESSRKAIYKLIEKARAADVYISFDPNIRPTIWDSQEQMIEVLNHVASKCDMVLPGIGEGEILVGSDDPDKIADFYLDMGVESVVVKLGSKGAFVKNKEESFTVPGFKVEKVVDTVGAGDGFAVGVISGILEGLTLKDSVIRGNAIGSLQVMVQGDNDGLPKHDKLEKYIKEQNI